MYDEFGGEDGTEKTKIPKFQGLLSTSVHESSNLLVVSAPGFVLKPVTEIVQKLDEAARPSSTVKTVKVGAALQSKAAREALIKALGKKEEGNQPPGPQNGQPNGQPQQPQQQPEEGVFGD